MHENLTRLFAAALATLVVPAPAARAWDHPGHMLTAAIAYNEIARTRPELIDRIALMLLKHPDPASFWVAATEVSGKERGRRMFIEAARWPDDAKWTIYDHPTYHSARFSIVAEDAPPEARALVASRNGAPLGDAIEAATLFAKEMANPEANPDERALSLSWFMHIVGDIHQPLHVTDLVNAEYPTGNAAGTMSYVWDPLKDTAMPLHILWDSNALRSTRIEDIDRSAAELVAKFPRADFPQLGPPTKSPDFRAWALESHQIAIDYAYGSGIKTTPDPDRTASSDRLVGNMVKYILEGVSPIKEAPKVPQDYWEQLQQIAQAQITLAGYRIADVIIAAADSLMVERSATGALLDSMARHGATAD
ncbi:S1/P1 nuclease [Salipiger sp. H15]|uniref:S1/P1 nuclease n=1 Tax=Alloyangia sp. H15 TaxID=3029062 RepID=A0AAU8AEN6_9RHOB